MASEIANDINFFSCKVIVMNASVTLKDFSSMNDYDEATKASYLKI